jgi:hypothetical protein
MGTLWHVGKEPKPVEKSALPSEKLLEEMLVANLRILYLRESLEGVFVTTQSVSTSGRVQVTSS